MRQFFCNPLQLRRKICHHTIIDTMTSMTNRIFYYVNDDYGFDMDDDKEPSARTSTGASKNHKKKKASKPVTIWSEIFSYIKILAAAVIIAFVFTQYIIVNAEVPTGSMKNTIMEHIRKIRAKFAAHTLHNYIETVWGCGYRWNA